MHVRFSLVAGVVSVLVLSAALGAYFYFKYAGRPAFDPQGVLLLSLSAKGSSEVNLYEYDLATAALRRLGQDGNSNFDGRFSADGQRIAHIAYGPRALASQVVVYDPSSGERRPVSRGEGFRHSPDWSPVGNRLAYAEDTKDGSDIYAADLPSSPRCIGAGSYPVWSLDGAFLFSLAPEGLVRYSLDSGSSVTVWGARGSGMKLAASRDHSQIAWLNPARSEVRLFLANPVRQRELLFSKVISADAYDAAFSPDNAYLALRVREGDGATARYFIAIERLDSGERREVLDLSLYDPGSLFLSSWK